jgi:peptidoglycan/xylan/chitin deacetylase (PgdA/CDA1 family)
MTRLKLLAAAAGMALPVLGGIGLLLFQPTLFYRLLARRSPEVLFTVPTHAPLIALTIDDGPDPQTTTQILSLLAEHDARATFFLITDHVTGNEALVDQMLVEGHEIGNHSVADEPSIALSLEAFESKLLAADAQLGQFADVTLFRPGSGLYNRRMLDTLAQHGYQNVLGSVHPFDPQIPHAGFAGWYVLQNAEPGAIVILHDRGARGERTIAVLKRVLPELKSQGYRVVTVSELLAQAAR